MKVIGMIGGMSWESSLEYYRIINLAVKEKLGGLHSARSLMYSVDFDEIEKLQHKGDWDKATELMVEAACRLKNGGADFIIICTNTMHKMADEVERGAALPLLHIADATAGAVKEQGLTTVGLLGTRFTMEEDFYRARLEEKHQIKVLVPGLNDRQLVHDVIYNELCLGKVTEGSRRKYIDIIERLSKEGAEGVILGCTEIPLLIKQDFSPLPLFDTTDIHARGAVDFALAD